jgi:NADH-quinone oxidoreductase subunit D
VSAGTRRVTEGSLSESLGFPETVVEVGLTHPAVRQSMTAVGGTASFVIQLDDDRITDLEVEVGYGHRGFEKEVENVPWALALPYVSRLGYAGGLIAETAYCLAVENLLGCALPDRAIWLRMLANELARVTDHFSRLANVMSAIGLREAEQVAQAAEVEAGELLARATGDTPLAGWVQFGGVARALPADFGECWSAAQPHLDLLLSRFETVGVSNPTCVRRLRGVAQLGVEDCQAWGVTGPTLRAAGSPFDLRRDRPYLAYGALDFSVPVGESGDGLDRLLVVVEEIRQSLGMVEQCRRLLGSLGPGAIALDRREFQGQVQTSATTSAGESGEVDAEIVVPKGESVSTVESTTGELSFFVASDGAGLPRRIRARSPSFFHAQAMPLMIRGARLDDLLPTAALLHLISGECDR